MFTELGPYVLDKDLNITINPFAWNKVANVLFLEQPVGVGFSYQTPWESSGIGDEVTLLSERKMSNRNE